LYEQADNRRYYQQELSLLVTGECENITDSLPSLPSVERLEYLENCVDCNISHLNADDKAKITEICSRILASMVRNNDLSLLDQILSMILKTWRPGLLTTDITEDIINRLINIMTSNVFSVSSITDKIIIKMFSLLSMIVSDEEHCQVLCRASDSCYLTSIISSWHTCLRDHHQLQQVTCRLVIDWLSLCDGVDHQTAWTNFHCSHCTSEVIRFLVVLTQSQVVRVPSQRDYQHHNLSHQS